MELKRERESQFCFNLMQHKAKIPPININPINQPPLISLSRGAGGETPAPQLHHPLFPRPRGGLPWESQRDPVGHPLSALGRPVPPRAPLLPQHLRVQVSDVHPIWVPTGGRGSACGTERPLCRTDTRGMSNPGVRAIISRHANGG